MPLKASAVFRPRSSAGQFVSARITPVVKAAVEEACKLVEQRAKDLVPVDTGALQASITTTVEEGSSTVVGRVGTDLFYGVYVEYGTGIRGQSSPGAGKGPYSPTWPGMAAQPFMRPAIDESKEAVKEIFANDLRIALK